MTALSYCLPVQALSTWLIVLYSRVVYRFGFLLFILVYCHYIDSSCITVLRTTLYVGCVCVYASSSIQVFIAVV
jgi:hypothetical protein